MFPGSGLWTFSEGCLLLNLCAKRVWQHGIMCNLCQAWFCVCVYVRECVWKRVWQRLHSYVWPSSLEAPSKITVSVDRDISPKHCSGEGCCLNAYSPGADCTGRQQSQPVALNALLLSRLLQPINGAVTPVNLAFSDTIGLSRPHMPSCPPQLCP